MHTLQAAFVLTISMPAFPQFCAFSHPPQQLFLPSPLSSNLQSLLLSPYSADGLASNFMEKIEAIWREFPPCFHHLICICLHNVTIDAPPAFLPRWGPPPGHSFSSFLTSVTTGLHRSSSSLLHHQFACVCGINLSPILKYINKPPQTCILCQLHFLPFFTENSSKIVYTCCLHLFFPFFLLIFSWTHSYPTTPPAWLLSRSPVPSPLSTPIITSRSLSHWLCNISCISHSCSLGF